jgi:hypothetical protein
VILKILAQESPDSELRLKRYEGKKFWGLNMNLEVSGAYFKNGRGSGEKDLQFGARGGAILKNWRVKDYSVNKIQIPRA